MVATPEAALEGPLAEVVRRLVEALQPERIYLFGSQARGDATEDSDFDLLVIVERRQDQPVRMEQQAYRALRGLPGAVDVVVMTRTSSSAGGRWWRRCRPPSSAREGSSMLWRLSAPPRSENGCRR